MTESKENKFALAIQEQLTTTLLQKAASLPKNFNQTKFTQNCLTALDSIPDITECEPSTVVKVLMKGAVLGLDFLNKECYAICYKNNKTGKVDVNFQTDYKGDRKLAKIYSVEPIDTINAEIVRENDFFEVVYDDNKKNINFRPVPFNDGKIIGAFCVINFKNGSSISDSMSVKEMENIRDNYSKAKSSPAWEKSKGEMFKKTVQKRVLKLVEKSFESTEQLRAYDDCSDFEFNNETIQEPSRPLNVFAEPAQIETKAENNDTIEPEEIFHCADCGEIITEAENGYSKKMFKRPLCRACQKAEKDGRK